MSEDLGRGGTSEDDDRQSDVFPWDSLQFFLELVRKHTLMRAARRLGVSHTTVLRRIARLERELDAKLFERDASGFTLTPAGRDLLEHAESMERVADQIFRTGRTHDRLTGPVRIASIEGLATRVLAPALVRFAEKYPQIGVELVSMMQTANLGLREVDISIGPAELTGPRLTSRVLGRCDVHLYAARGYLDRFGNPSSVDDLPRHRFVDYVEDLIEIRELNWFRETIGRRNVVFRSTSPNVQVEAVRRGMGIGMFPDYMVIGIPEVEPVLSDTVVAERSYWIAMHAELWRVPRMDVTARFLAGTLTEHFGFRP